MPVYGAPKRSMARPTSSRTSGLSALTSFGPTMPAFERYASSTSRRTRSGRARRRRGTGAGRSRPRPCAAPRWRRRGSPAPSSRRRTNARGQHRGDPRGGVVVGPAVDDEHGEVVVVLVGQRRERVLEPGARVAGDDHRDDRRVLGERLLVRLVVELDVAGSPRGVRGGGGGSSSAGTGRVRPAVRACSSGPTAYRRALPAPGHAEPATGSEPLRSPP